MKNVRDKLGNHADYYVFTRKQALRGGPRPLVLPGWSNGTRTEWLLTRGDSCLQNEKTKIEFTKHFRMRSEMSQADSLIWGRWRQINYRTPNSIPKHNRSQGGQGTLKISSISCFVLWEAVSQTKYCCSL